MDLNIDLQGSFDESALVTPSLSIVQHQQTLSSSQALSELESPRDRVVIQLPSYLIL